LCKGSLLPLSFRIYWIPYFQQSIAGRLNSLLDTILDYKISLGKNKIKLWKNFKWDWYADFLNNPLYCNSQMQVLSTIFLNMQVNIIVATSILEEGLDVQTCNLVIRFDPSPTVCSFIQSRGRARMQNSDYILMVNR